MSASFPRQDISSASSPVAF